MNKQTTDAVRLTDNERLQLVSERQRVDASIESVMKDFKEKDPKSSEGYLDELNKRKIEIDEKLYADDYWKKVLEYRASYDENIKNYAFGNVISDVYSDVSDDSLKRGNLAKTIADIWFQSSTVGAFNVGLIGKWGSGKSAFMQSVKEGISNHKNAHQVIAVDYNASEYEDTETLWTSLTKKLFGTYEKDVLFPKTRYFFSKLSFNKPRVFEIAIIKIMTLILLIALLAFSKGLYSHDQVVAYATSIVTGCGTLILAITQIILPILKYSTSAATSLAIGITEKTKLPSHKNNLGTRGEISEEIHILFNAWLKRKRHKVVIFVDELDRCSEKGVIEFFQSMQLFLNNEKINFVFAIDPDYLKKAIQNHYDIPDEDVEHYSNEYLDKYISVVVPMNEVNDYSAYIENMLRHIEDTEGKKCFFEDEIKTIKRCIDATKKDALTPRKVKKILNALVLLKEYCVAEVNKKHTIDFNEFVTWFIFSIVYPAEAQLLRDAFNPDKAHFPLGLILDNDPDLMKSIGCDECCLKYIDFMRGFIMTDITLYSLIAHNYTLIV